MHPANRAGYRLLAAPLAALAIASAPLAEPLHPPGKRDIYERVLTRPGARLGRGPGDPGQETLKPLSRLYVFARERAGGREWLRVGAGTRDASILGWLPAERTVPWKQQLTLVFTNRGAGRAPMPFLQDWSDLRALLDSPDPAASAESLRHSAASGRPDPSLLALEPADFVDFSRQFYLLPILDFAEYRAATGDKVRGLKVASVALPDPSAPAPLAQSAPGDYRAAVVFVIDSTVSMRPYIERTKAAVARFYERVREAGVVDRVAFGLVAFRAPSADPARARRLGFVARTYVNPAEVRDGGDFLRRVRDLDEASVSTDWFEEDPYAGILAALDIPDWRARFAERHLILITDAGALDGSLHDPATGTRLESTTRLNAERLRSIAGESGTSIAVMHLLTPEAERSGNTETAEAQYRTLANNAANQQTAYFPIAAGAPESFQQAIDSYAERMIENMARFGGGLDVQGLGRVAAADPAPTPGSGEGLAQIRSVVDSLGHAARLAYLGQVRGTRAPDVFEAWISDRDFADPSKIAAEVRVLLTKDQLSDLQEVLKGIVSAAEADMSDTTARSFFDRLASVAAKFSVDPQAGGIERSTRLADLGLIGEYLEGLPYRSDVLNLTQDTWTRWGTMRQIDFIDLLKKKILRYGIYYADRGKWVDLSQSGASDRSETVYPIPLDDLP